MEVIFLLKLAALKCTHTQPSAHTLTPDASFQMGIKIHVQNAAGCVAVHGLTCTVKQLFVFVHASVLKYNMGSLRSYIVVEVTQSEAQNGMLL